MSHPGDLPNDPAIWLDGLVREHLSALRGYVASLGTHPDLVDDLVQDILLAVFCNRDRYDAVRPIRGWIFGIARNLVHQEFRKRRIDARVRLGLAMETASVANDPSTEDDEILSNDHAVGALRSCLQGLGQRARQLMELHYQQQMTTHAIAVATGAGDSAVRMGLMRAREALRQCVEHRVRGNRGVSP